MLNFWKVTILLCLLLQFSSGAQAAGWKDYIPDRTHLAKAEAWVMEHSSRETRIFLYSNLPSLFTVNALCQLRDGTSKQAVLPLDEFRSLAENSELECPTHAKFLLGKDAVGSISYAGPEIAIRMKAGKAELITGGKPVAFEFPGFTLRITSSEPSTRLSARITAQGPLVYCSRGLAEGEVVLAAGTQSSPEHLGTSNCRLSLKYSGQPKARYLFSDQLLSPRDLNVPPEQMPKLNFQELEKKFPAESLASKSDSKINILLEPPRNPADPLIMRIGKSNPSPANCVLYSQASAEAPLVQAYQFKIGNDPNTPVKLHPDYKKYYLSVICSDARGMQVSNGVAPY